jgi:hypothetical protein
LAARIAPRKSPFPSADAALPKLLAIPAAPATAPLTAPKVADAAPIFDVIPAAESKKPIYLSPLASIYLTKLST